MRTPILLTILAAAFGLNLWFGDRVPAGAAACPLIASSSLVDLATPTGGDCPRQSPVRR